MSYSSPGSGGREEEGVSGARGAAMGMGAKGCCVLSRVGVVMLRWRLLSQSGDYTRRKRDGVKKVKSIQPSQGRKATSHITAILEFEWRLLLDSA